jgi:M6 family metalloprotease-like protein
VTAFYAATSYGRVSITYEFLPKELWVQMTQSAADYRLTENIPQWHNGQLARDALALVDASVNFGLYDGVVLSTGYSTRLRAGEAFVGMTFQTKNGIAKGVSFEAGSSTGDDRVMAHELGHSLFGLEDLYVFTNRNRPTAPDPTPAGTWDMMSMLASEFFGWNKLLAGWLEPTQVRCISDQASTTHYVETLEVRSDKPKVVLINLADGVTLAIEVRTEQFFSGVLVYKIDTRIQHGDGPILSEKLLLAPGAALTRDGWTIKVVGFDSKGFLIEVNRG